MQNIQEKAITTYQVNMEYFKRTHEAVYNKIAALDAMLSDGTYPQKYDLEYKNGYFDVVDLSSNNFLYNQDSNQFSDQVANNNTFKKDDQVISTYFNFTFSKEAVKKAKNSDALSSYATIAPIVDYCQKNLDSDISFKKIFKFIFLGVGLGLHIPLTIEKIMPEAVYIIEDDIELFRLSLFTCNYETSLTHARSYFSIGATNSEFTKTLDEFYTTAFARNHYFKFSIFSTHYEAKISEIQTFLVSRPEKCYAHERILYKNQKVLEKLYHYKFLDLKKKNISNQLTKKPFLILAAGPSLKKEINFVKENHNKYVIVAAIAALKTLYIHDIKPDIVVQIDEQVAETNNLINSFDNLDFLNDALFILNASVPDILFEKFHKENIFLVEDRTYYMQNELHIKAASIGEIAYSMALIFNIENIYLLGIDLALSDDGATHAGEHHRNTKLDTSKTDTLEKVLTIEKSTMTIKGNFQERVTTTPLFAISIPLLNAYTSNLKSPHQKVYNLSHGAYFENITPLFSTDAMQTKYIDKRELSQELKTIFNTYSKIAPSQDDLAILEKRKEQIKYFYQYLHTFSKNDYTTPEQFLNAYTDMIDMYLKSPETELKELLSVYFLNTSDYITDFFNTKELSKINKHIQKMKKLITIQLKKNIEAYESFLNDIKE